MKRWDPEFLAVNLAAQLHVYEELPLSEVAEGLPRDRVLAEVERLKSVHKVRTAITRITTRLIEWVRVRQLRDDIS